MLKLRPAEERGHMQIDWLDSRHTFSFGYYHDPAHMNFRALRVINEDVIAPGAGFPTHPHRDMEILTWVLEGTLRHHDSLGHTAELRAGEIQYLCAGTGVTHSEYNDSNYAPLHLLQVWLVPERRGLPAAYRQTAIDLGRINRWHCLAAPAGRDAAVTLHQDTSMFVARLDAGTTLDYALAPGRHAWLQIARGGVVTNGTLMSAGDGLAVADESALSIKAGHESEVLLFDLA